MKPSEVRELTDADVRARIVELEEERFRLKFRAATETLEDPLRLRHIRHDIARLHTILRERELAAGAPRRGRKNAAAARRQAREQQQQQQGGAGASATGGAAGSGSAQGTGRRRGGRGAGATTTGGAR